MSDSQSSKDAFLMASLIQALRNGQREEYLRLEKKLKRWHSLRKIVLFLAGMIPSLVFMYAVTQQSWLVLLSIPLVLIFLVLSAKFISTRIESVEKKIEVLIKDRADVTKEKDNGQNGYC